MSSFPFQFDQATIQATDDDQQRCCQPLLGDHCDDRMQGNINGQRTSAPTTKTTDDGEIALSAAPISRTSFHRRPASEKIMAQPPTYDLNESYEKVVAASLQHSSAQDRERSYEIVHGVDEDTEESEDFILQKLHELQDCLNSIASKPAYDLALQKNRPYVEDRAFRLKFLRCEEFRSTDAAKRMVRHFTTKLDLWGEEKLAHDITLASCSALAQEMMPKAANLQVLPVRDTSGRAVLFSFERYHRQLYKTEAPEIYMVQNYWYYLMSAIEDEETQKKGIVYLIYALDHSPAMDEQERKVFWNCCAVTNALPIRIASIHSCTDAQNPAVKPLMSLISLGMQHSVRCRMRMHYGTQQEVLYALLSFGLPIFQFPVTDEGGWKANHLKPYWNYRRHKEGNPTKYKNATYIPKRLDVLLGRGKPYQSHHGTLQLHEVLVLNYEDYNGASRKGKNGIARKVVNLVKSTGARFLKKDENDIWVEVSDDDAKDKVTHGFRRHREMQKGLVRLEKSARSDRGERQHNATSKRSKKTANPFGGCCKG